MQIYIARLQKFSDALEAENKNVFSFAAKVQTADSRQPGSTLAVQAADCSIHVGQPLQSSWRRWQYESVERTGFWCRCTAADVDQPRTTQGRSRRVRWERVFFISEWTSAEKKLDDCKCKIGKILTTICLEKFKIKLYFCLKNKD